MSQPHHTLEQLKEKSRTAAADPELAEIAAKCTPTQAFEVAEAKGLRDFQCHKVRYLTMLRRDFGEEVFLAFCDQAMRERQRLLAERKPCDDIIDILSYTSSDIMGVLRDLEMLQANSGRTSDIHEALRRLKSDDNRNPKHLLVALEDSKKMLAEFIEANGG
jgi:hypothetical protein